MSDKVDVFMPFYVRDYLADTTDLTVEEHGAYMLLLLDLWTRQGAPLPVDPRRLARIARVDQASWSEVWRVISRFFVVTPEGITQKRLAHEMERAKANADRARKGAAARWGRQDAPQDAQSMLGGCSDDANADAKRDAQEPDRICTPTSPPTSPSEKDLPPSGARARSEGPQHVAQAQKAPGSLTGPISKPTDPAIWDAERWKLKFEIAWCEKYGAIAMGGGVAVAKACADLSDILAGLPASERKAAQARAPEMFAEYFRDGSPAMVRDRHPWKWFVDRFGGLRVPVAPLAGPPGSRKPGKPAPLGGYTEDGDEIPVH